MEEFIFKFLKQLTDGLQEAAPQVGLLIFLAFLFIYFHKDSQRDDFKAKLALYAKLVIASVMILLVLVIFAIITRNQIVKTQPDVTFADPDTVKIVEENKRLSEQNSSLNKEKQYLSQKVSSLEQEVIKKSSLDKELKIALASLDNSIPLSKHNEMLNNNSSLIEKLSNDLYSTKNAEHDYNKIMSNLFFGNNEISDYNNARQNYYDNALKFFREQAEKGNIEAQFFIGYILDPLHNKIKIKEKQDADKAIVEYKKAEGHAEAQYCIANLYFVKKGDKTNAVKWYKYAADNGHQGASIMLERLK